MDSNIGAGLQICCLFNRYLAVSIDHIRVLYIKIPVISEGFTSKRIKCCEFTFNLKRRI